jgi:hypothetical protein
LLGTIQARQTTAVKRAIALAFLVASQTVEEVAVVQALAPAQVLALEAVLEVVPALAMARGLALAMVQGLALAMAQGLALEVVLEMAQGLVLEVVLEIVGRSPQAQDRELLLEIAIANVLQQVQALAVSLAAGVPNQNIPEALKI